MIMRARPFAALALAVALLAGAGAGAPAEAQRRDPTARREKVKQKVRAMRAWILTEELELDEATAGKLVPVLARFDDELARLLVERAQLLRELAAAEAAGDPRVLDRLIDKLVANQQARWALEQQRFTDLRKLLTPRQTARLIDVLPQLDQRIRQGMRRGIRAGALDGEPAPGRTPRRPRRSPPAREQSDMIDPFADPAGRRAPPPTPSGGALKNPFAEPD